ncbi:Na+/H+ antiporter NhaC family protein [Romboutsia sp. 1001216sp1]|uniref:Na+/H+ antiporter NhaC family protein n=1 Tax=Romboutsia TaxID=1501226 RepID=UPI000B00624B|nr:MULTISPECIES: Na+/H+ antiporter NhaC family protein [Romboutsia]MDB8793500.1 Na+/H+ antiporter NhaC family protein [Romboutsia sp. 1001216sp1]MDB8797042.1 Na+/H+ antiporter NhaC family protein [Romboutsia sp. 1001216sp1]MDB8799788.1 Na+/H+ antiporter NhaC family protein [Romboutsia sp. 1001216sp1]MDB8805626.1 Na+/H+ antiporter NhaC family protein [Romboutsia sp. 1001216sp1]MDB8808662.1 Na+/H+ antiporter NhaC family protein [Romboutsia sp. 1001216sp1]
MKEEAKKGSILGLLPLGVFLIVFLGSGVITGDFYKMPAIVAFIIATIVGFSLNRKVSLGEKIEVFCKGAGNIDIISMIMIFILAGSFSSVAKAMGGVDSTVNLSLSILPPNLLVSGLFVIGCFISISMGTSMGTIAALGPIGIGIAAKTGIPAPLVIGAVVGGAMFGDNLSMISDTTIAATKTQGCELKDKFRVNFLIVLPAAIITAILLATITSGYSLGGSTSYRYDFIKVLPYLGVLLGALCGVNVFVLLSFGVVFAGAIGLFTNSFGLFGFIEAISGGISGMYELCLLVIIIGGLVELIKLNGGIDFILNFISSKIKTKKGAEFGIAALVSIVDLCTANNTIAIVTAGPLAKDIATKFDIDNRKTASILDIFSSCWQGIVPYGAQVLTAAGMVGISPVELIKYLHYPWLMLACGIIAITFGIPNLNKVNKRKKEVA